MKIQCESTKELPKTYHELKNGKAYWNDEVGLFIFLKDGMDEYLFIVNKSSMSTYENDLLNLEDAPTTPDSKFYPWFGKITITF